MASFDVYGPFRIHYSRKVGGKIIETQHGRDFWLSPRTEYLQSERGVYVFAMRAGPGLTPLYVGKATKTFRQEVFTDRNLHKVTGAMADWRRGNPVLFLLAQTQGRVATRAIAELERFLINEAVLRNPDLRNVQGIDGGPRYEVPGVTGVKRGRRTTAQIAFRRLLGLR